ncbi:MAG: hypothetical protein QF489_03620 [Planctomycetota bacterium]|nr:hypothetical protein [Planctomycetota bacterium]
MNERIAVLLVVLLLELLGGLGLRNEATAARGRIEVQRRCKDECNLRINFFASLFNEATTPANLQRELDRRRQQQDINNLPQL